MTGPHAAPHLPEHGQLAEINPACDIEQRWCNGWHSWVRRSDGGFDPDLYEVHPISDPVAKSYVERMHYSGSYVAASRRYGMFIHTPDGPDLVGVAVFAIPAQARVLTNVFPELVPYAESLELVFERVVREPDSGRAGAIGCLNAQQRSCTQRSLSGLVGATFLTARPKSMTSTDMVGVR